MVAAAGRVPDSTALTPDPACAVLLRHEQSTSELENGLRRKLGGGSQEMISELL